MIKTLISLLLVSLFVLLFLFEVQAQSVPRGWKQVIQCKVPFLIPDSLVADSSEGSYRNERMTLWFECHGKFVSPPSSENPNYLDFKEGSVDGKQAWLIRYKSSPVRDDQNLLVRLFIYEPPPFEGASPRTVDVTFESSDPKDWKLGVRILMSAGFQQ